MVDMTGSHSARIDLRVEISLPQSEAGGQIVRIDFVGSRLDVDDDEIHRIAALEVRANVLLKDCFATLDDCFFAMAAFGGSHVFLQSRHLGASARSPS